jgi:C1A family cysteine protease
MKALFLILALILSTNAEAKHSLGLKRDPLVMKAFKAKSRHKQALRGVVIPQKVDLCQFVKIRDQGSCGSCWDFSLTNTLESQYRAQGVETGTLGVNYLGGCSQYTPMCSGGDFPAAEYFVNYGQSGVWLESQFPYTANNVRCKAFPIAAHAVAYHMLGDGTNPASFADIASELAQGKLISVDVGVDSSWENYSGGIYSGRGTGINHMVGICGFDTEGAQFDASGNLPSGKGYVTVYNSWGKSWGISVDGQGGFMYSRLGAASLGDSALVFDIPVAPPSPTPTPTPTPTPSPVPPPQPSWHGFLCGWIHWLPWCSFN